MNIIRPSAAFSLAFALAACAKSNERPPDTTAIDTTVITTSSSTGSSQQAEPPGGVATPETAWAVTEHGIGKLRAGMTVGEARAVLPTFTVSDAGDGTACTYARVDGLPTGVGVMVEGGKVARVEVRRGNVATSAGARIGDSEERIKSLYPKQVSVSPHKYTDGHYLTVVPASKADSAYRIIFETDGKKVVNFRAGIRPQVEYVEGCS